VAGRGRGCPRPHARAARVTGPCRMCAESVPLSRARRRRAWSAAAVAPARGPPAP
jgi:hypothetical protein